MLRAGVRRLWVEYTSNPSIHGVRFLASRRISMLEKTIWLIVMIVAGCIIIEQIWKNWKLSESYPIQIVENGNKYSLKSFYFPAVTLCSVFKIKYKRAEEHVRRTVGANATEEDISSYWNTLIAIALLHFPHYSFPYLFMANFNVTPYPLNSHDIPDIMKEIGHQVEDILQSCTWKGVEYNCSEMFQLQATEEGFCHSFNSFTSEEALRENTSLFPFQENGEPLKNVGAGKHTGLELALKPPDDQFYHQFQEISMGYNIIIHGPHELPDVSWNIKIGNHPSSIQRIYIKPTIITATDSLRQAPKSVRRCNWRPSTDNPMAYDKNYCFVQCRLNATVEMCNCYPYYFKAKPGYEQCDMRHVKCLKEIEVKIRNHKTNEKDNFVENKRGQLICNCINPCSFIKYDTEKVYSTLNFPYPSGQYAIVDVSYKERYGYRFIKEIKFTFKDLAVTTGGLASLLLGCSLISVLEILYFMGRLCLLAIRSAWRAERRQINTTFNYPFIN